MWVEINEENEVISGYDNNIENNLFYIEEKISTISYYENNKENYFYILQDGILSKTENYYKFVKNELRNKRNQLLSQTDYITLRAYSQGKAVPQEWADYMQALRDLPETAQPELDEDGNLTNVEWPTKPSESV